MKKLLLIALAAFVPFSMVFAQMPDPANFHIYYGNTDGSELTVGINKDINVPVWGATDAAPGNPDTVNFMHMPLMSDDLVITARLGGNFVNNMLLWQDISFLSPDRNSNDPAIPVGFSSQSILGFAWTSGNRPTAPYWWLYTLGVPQLLGNFAMHTANDPLLINTHPTPFAEGHNVANQLTLWGMADGVRNVKPTLHFSGLFFSPNQPPVIVSPADGATFNGECQIVIPILGNDPDEGQTLTFTADHGVVAAVQDGQTIAGTLTLSDLGTYDVVLTLSDGTDLVHVTLHVAVVAGLNSSVLSIDCTDAMAPGSLVTISLDLCNPCAPVGGFETMICWDCTALTLVDAQPTARLHQNPNGGYGWEYWNWVRDPMGCGSARFVYIADTPERPDTPPIEPGCGGVVDLTFRLATGLPFSADVPITFCNEGPNDYTSNTISDETGNIFVHPELTPGCIYLADPATFRGDPNMNCFLYEVGDAVLVAQRLINGMGVWAGDDLFQDALGPNGVLCGRHPLALGHNNDASQEAAADLNGNGHADIADLVRFINILNGYVFPKVDPVSGQASFLINDGAVRINSNVEVGGVLVSIKHTGEIGTPIAANGMTILSKDANGVLSVLIYSLEGKRIPSGNQTLFTLTGEGTITEASASDADGFLMESRVGAPIPTQFGVSQNYPNPFNAKTLINFALPTASDVTINIYSITGQVVETLKGTFEAGNQSMTWDASQVASGVYFAKVSAGSNNQTLKMTLLK